jgi:hypothetical protein
MKQAMRFLAQLYPSSWRKRYGAELDALLEDATPSVRDAFDVFWGALKMQMTTRGFGRITLACSVAGILVAGAVSFAAPVHYLSQAIFTATPADESTRRLVNNLELNIFSRESLTAIIQKHNLYPRERARRSLDNVIDRMARNIRVDPHASPRNQDALTFVVQFDYLTRLDRFLIISGCPNHMVWTQRPLDPRQRGGLQSGFQQEVLTDGGRMQQSRRSTPFLRQMFSLH